MKTTGIKINQYTFILIYALAFSLSLFKVFHVPITHDEVATTVHYANFSVWQIMMYPDTLPNNHILNTIFTKIFLLFFGNDQWVVRLPNLLSFFLYTFGVFRILKTVVKDESIFFIPAALLFIANPYLLDFFGLCRGYGMSVAFCTLAVGYLISGYVTKRSKDIYLGFILSILASYANFTLLVFWAAATILTWFFFFTLYRDRKTSLLKPTLIIFFSCLLYAALIAVPIYKIQSTNQFQYWTSIGFYNDTLLPLIDYSLYGSKFFLAPAVTIIAFLVIILLIINSIFIFIRFKDSHFQITSLFRPVFVATAIILLTAGINIIQCIILNTPNLNGRTALFFYPLFIIAFVTTLGLVSKIKSRLVKKGLSVLITVVCLFHLAQTVNLKSVREWEYDANTFKVIEYLDKERNKQNTSLETNWLFNPSFFFYKYTGKTPWLDLKDYNRYIIPNTGAEYYYVLAEDYQILKTKFEPVLKFNNGCWLLKRRQLSDTQIEAIYNAAIKEKIQKIKIDKKWFDLIKEKARENNIPLDSMLYRDAKYMLDKFGY